MLRKVKPFYWQVLFLVVVVLTLLKLFGVITVSWWLVMLPYIISIGWLIITPIRVMIAGQIRDRKKKNE